VLKSHYLGEMFTTCICVILDGRINLAFFDGKAHNFTYVFTDLASSRETVDESRKIWLFMQGFHDPLLQSATLGASANVIIEGFLLL
jgi:hypothetical protein